MPFRFLDLPGVLRTLRYLLVGGGTLLFDLLLLYVLVSRVNVPLAIATPASFLVAVSINYFISHRFVFTRTERSHTRGYTYFLLTALAGALATTVLVTVLSTTLLIPYLFARILSAGVVGCANYFTNLFLTFRVAGKH